MSKSKERSRKNPRFALASAIDQWAVEKGKKDGDTVVTSEAASYLKTAWSDNDLLGNAYTISTLGTNQVKISGSTKTALSGVGIDWGAF